MNGEVELEDLPSKEGLNVSSVISTLYTHVDQEKARDVSFKMWGMNYENILILSVFRSAAL